MYGLIVIDMSLNSLLYSEVCSKLPIWARRMPYDVTNVRIENCLPYEDSC